MAGRPRLHFRLLGIFQLAYRLKVQSRPWKPARARHLRVADWTFRCDFTLKDFCDRTYLCPRDVPTSNWPETLSLSCPGRPCDMSASRGCNRHLSLILREMPTSCRCRRALLRGRSMWLSHRYSSTLPSSDPCSKLKCGQPCNRIRTFIIKCPFQPLLLLRGKGN